jgi:hypothetical protein
MDRPDRTDPRADGRRFVGRTVAAIELIRDAFADARRHHVPESPPLTLAARRAPCGSRRLGV